MKIKHLPSWPPKWNPVPSFNESLLYERGIVKTGRNWGKQLNSIELAIEHEDKRYWGTLSIDLTVRDKVLRVLGANMGLTLKEIGDLDMDPTDRTVGASPEPSVPA